MVPCEAEEVEESGVAPLGSTPAPASPVTSRLPSPPPQLGPRLRSSLWPRPCLRSTASLSITSDEKWRLNSPVKPSRGTLHVDVIRSRAQKSDQ